MYNDMNQAKELYETKKRINFSPLKLWMHKNLL